VDRRQFVLGAASSVAAVAVAPRALAARLGGTPVAFVTADVESHVVVVELATSEIVARIPTAPGPRSIESFQQRIAVVGHTQQGLVSVLDAATYRVRTELSRFEAPRYTAFHPSAALAYITDSAAEEVVTVDSLRGRVLARTRVPGPRAAHRHQHRRAHPLDVARDGGRAHRGSRRR
jgi:DNA-binding beta-propeller fold protein YncE